MASDGPSDHWQRLHGKIASEILCAPKTGGDPQNPGTWAQVPEKLVAYLEQHVVGNPWAEPLALMVAVMLARRLDIMTVKARLSILHMRFNALFPALGLKQMEEWKVDQHLPAYLKAELLPNDTLSTRAHFWRGYQTGTKLVSKWWEALPEHEQALYQRFLLPLPNPYQIEGLVKFQELARQAQRQRKAETDAVVPLFAELRAEAHRRYNRLARLRQAYRAAIQQVEQQRGKAALPLAFSYDEGGDSDRGLPAQERLHFCLWDQQSFVLAHRERYHPSTVIRARKGRPPFAPSQRKFFLELVKAERLLDHAPVEGFWFDELLRRGVLGVAPSSGSPTDIAARQEWLRSWGYNEKGAVQQVHPFLTGVAGLLTWEKASGEAQFVKHAQARTEGTLLPVEAIYAGATFGLLAINLFTTTGMRMNEAMQVRTSKECFVRLLMPPVPGARDQSPRVRYLLRLIPKGERTNTPHNYYIGDETKRLLVKVGQMLLEYSGLQASTALDALPVVSFSPSHGRAHRFGPARYVFQYHGYHLSDLAITACMKFLLHGMVFRTQEGKPVILKAHLLRHAFATHAVQVGKIPIDIVGAWLKQKNLHVTAYYSEVTETMTADTYDRYLAGIATQIKVGDAILRSPEELQRLYEAAQRKVGTLAEVIGGECVDDHFCPIKFQCIGCPAKVPNPAKRYQVERRQLWTLQQIQAATEEGLLPEAERLKQHVRECEAELREMDQIEAYRRDEQHVPEIRIDPQE